MTTNQTISFPRELSDELGELIAEKARVCGGGAFDIWEAICEKFGTEQPAPAAVEWPRLEKPAMVGAARFAVGVSTRLVVGAAQRLYEYEVTPDKEAQRIARVAENIAALHAPVAVVLPEPKVVSLIVAKAAREADLISGANYYTAAELAADAILFEIAALNTK